MVDSLSEARQKFVDNVANDAALRRFKRETTEESFVNGLTALDGVDRVDSATTDRFTDGVDEIDTNSDLQGELSDSEIGQKWEDNFTAAIEQGEFQGNRE